MVSLDRKKSSNLMDNQINMDSIRSVIKLTNVNCFPLYLKEIFKDLVERTESNKKKGLTRIIFYEYIKLPTFISDKLFDSLDVNKDGFLDKNEFIDGLYDLYYGNLDKNLNIIFRMYDFDRDGRINNKDIKQLLSYLPLRDESKQIESVNELEKLMSKISIKDNLEKEDFINFIKNKSSELFLDLYYYLVTNYPFSIESVENFKKHPKLQNQNVDVLSEEENIASPKKTPFKTFDVVPDIEGFKLEPINDDFQIPTNLDNKKHHVINKEEIQENPYGIRSNVLATPSIFLKKNDEKIEDFSLDQSYKPPIQRKSSIFTQQINKSSVIYKITENGNLKSYFLKLFNKDIIYYKNDKCQEIIGMHNLSGTYVFEKGKEPVSMNFENKTLYPFSLIFSNKTRTYYCDKQEEAIDWINKIKEAIGYQNFLDVYDLTDTVLGNGKFGVVKLGIHKKTKEEVAIKIIKKSEMDLKDMELVKSEIDIMIMCRHPNIVRLLDKFESKDFTYIVMEYLRGNTFANYLEKSPIDALSESDCCKVIYQISNALDYMHTFGIVHRDLKPENIMIKTSLPYESSDSVKIMDFGLSKILGPTEKVSDGYGTLTYVAPEVLTRKPYNKSVDVWSLGVIVYYTLCGSFPFDDSSNDEEKIAKKTVFDELKFTSKYWNGKSKEVKDFIMKAMEKDMDKRATIKELLNHEWFKKFIVTSPEKKKSTVTNRKKSSVQY